MADETTVKLAPIGTRDSVAFVTRAGVGCGLESVSLPTYAPHPHQAMREHRLAVGLTLSDAASALCLRAVEVSEIERGARRFVDEAEWGAAICALRSFAASGDEAKARMRAWARLRLATPPRAGEGGSGG